jgi:regulator of replication initiation timing
MGDIMIYFFRRKDKFKEQLSTIFRETQEAYTRYEKILASLLEENKAQREEIRSLRNKLSQTINERQLSLFK